MVVAYALPPLENCNALAYTSYINTLELLAVLQALLAFQTRLRDASVLLFEDNDAVKHMVRNRCARNPAHLQVLRRIWSLVDSLGLHLRVVFVKSEDNPWADALSRGSPFDNLMLRPRTWLALQRLSLIHI